MLIVKRGWPADGTIGGKRLSGRQTLERVCVLQIFSMILALIQEIIRQILVTVS